jgi:hypothetical protein
MLLTLTFEGEGGGSGFYRRYQHVTIAPYQPNSGTVVYFQFANTYQDSITLTWRLTNQKYQSVLIYTQVFQPNPLIQKHIALPPHLFDGGPAQLRLMASKDGFYLEVNVVVYPVKTYKITRFDQGFESDGTITYINGAGVVEYHREQLFFTNMGAVQWHPYYGRFDWTPLHIHLASALSREVIFSQASLTLADHPALEGFDLVNGKRKVPLDVRLEGEHIQFQFPVMYVHPQTLRMSSIPLVDYVATRTLFFPLEAFADLKQHPLSLQFTLVHFHEIQVQYDFLYQGHAPYFGHCFESQFCITTYA